MKKKRVEDLTEAAVNWLVATLVYPDDAPVLDCLYDEGCYNFTTNWAEGGPIVDELLLSGAWQAWSILHGVTFQNTTDEGLPLKGWDWSTELEFTCTGTLEAACRAYIAWKLGPSAEVPEGLDQ